MVPRFYIVHQFYNFQPIKDVRGVSESQNDWEENELLKLKITLLAHLQFHDESSYVNRKKWENLVYLKMVT